MHHRRDVGASVDQIRQLEKDVPPERDPEKFVAVFPRDKRGTRLRGDHAQTIT
jgi:hypothetical protein